MALSEITVRKALASDVPTLHQLIAELALFEKEPEAFVLTEQDLLQHGFSTHPPLYEALLAVRADGAAAGMAMFYPKYSSWQGPCMFLEDLIVRQDFRRQGIGRLLLEEVLALAAARQMARVEWMVLDWNEGAHAFYQSLEAESLTHWWPYRLSGNALAKYRREPQALGHSSAL
jgi:GNAT superfamily N-acetyltransferase